MDAEWTNAHVVLRKELLKGVQRPPDQGYQELMKRTDDRIKRLEKDIQLQQCAIEQLGTSQDDHIGELQAMEQEDLHRLDERYQLLQQQLTVAQKELQSLEEKGREE